MAQIVWTEPALNNLEEIAEFIALDSFQAAQDLVHEVFDRVEKLKEQRQTGRKPPELNKKSVYREVIVVPCRIFYRLEKQKIIIVHVMRSERELRKFILQERAKINS